MIYDFPGIEEPIRQGDIFSSLPQVTFDPLHVLKTGDDGIEPTTWLEQLATENIEAIATVKPVMGIVITQDCDTTRDKLITFCRIDKITNIVPMARDVPQKPEKVLAWWNNIITKQSRSDQKWFYLPPDERMEFTEKMAADFQTLVTVDRVFLSQNKNLRVGRLKAVADEHFREHIAQYFRRYPYNEWYPLNKEEFESYKREPSRADSAPYPWQE